MRIRAKLASAFGAILLLFGLAIGLAFTAFAGMQHDAAVAVAADEMVYAVVEVQQFLTDVSATHEREGFDDARKYADRFRESVRRLEKLDPAHAGELGEFQHAFEAYYDLGQRMAERYLTQGVEAGNQVMKGQGGELGFDQLSDELSSKLTAYRASRLVQLHERAQRGYALLTGVLAVSLLAGFAIAFGLASSLTRRIGALRTVAERLSHGVLDHSLDVTGKDELADVARSFQEMVGYFHEVGEVAFGISHGDLSRTASPRSAEDRIGVALAGMVQNLRRVIGQVRDSSAAIAVSAHQTSSAAENTSSAIAEMTASIQQIAGHSNALETNVQETNRAVGGILESVQHVARDSEALSSATDQTSASIEELAASIHQVADHVVEADRSSATANEAAQTGYQAVQATVDGMREIGQAMQGVTRVIESLGKSSSEIGSIIEVIDDLAEQTNLLALNAAIEAARAGDAGRGFAVVADEVRKLAERSAKATGEIGRLIRGIQGEAGNAVVSARRGEEAIEEGTRRAQVAGGSLQAIVEATAQASRKMSEITHAIQEQTRASELITAAVGDMRSLTSEVTEAAASEARESERIRRTLSLMSEMSQQLATATAEQRLGSDQIVQATDSNARAAEHVLEQAKALSEAIAFFSSGGSTTPPPTTRLALSGR